MLQALQDTLIELLSKTSEKTSEKIIVALQQNSALTIAELAKSVGVATRSIERNLQKLQDEGRLRRIGPDKGGHWQVSK
jgi:predicted HTH transcriptional regulator